MLTRRGFVKILGLGVPAAVFLNAVGCGLSEKNVHSFDVQYHSNVLDASRHGNLGIESSLRSDGNGNVDVYVYKINNSDGLWVFEVNGNTVEVNAFDARVQPGDVVTWKKV